MVAAFTTSIAGWGSIFDKTNPMGFKKNQVATLEGHVNPETKIDLGNIHRLAISGKLNMPTLTGYLTGMLINTAYESVASKNDHAPLFEFFRHIRNAASHNNVFNFRDWEPQREARWRSKQIDHKLKGKANPFFGTVCFPDFVAAGDAILLLSDIEQHLK